MALAPCCLPHAADARPIAAAQAAQAKQQFDIPAGPLPSSLAAWSAITGGSIGTGSALPPVTTHPVRGWLTPAAALDRMLAGTGFRAVAVTPNLFRLERAPSLRPVPTGPPKPRRARRADRPGADIIVTATKRSESLSTLPVGLSVAEPDRVATGIVSPDSGTVASQIDGLAFTNLGPGRNRAFIRGIADSPFNGLSQSTVAVVIDNSRITYDAPDPDLLLLDVDRVEVLKGPQGPLYGSGALGGIFRIVTHSPELGVVSGAAALVGEAGAHGGLGGGGDATLNLPLARDALAVRAVGYYRSEPGWLDTIGGARDTNRTTAEGGRIAVRWTPDSDWTIDLGGILQSLNARDSQYVTGSAGALSRIHPVAEPADNDFAQAHLDIRGRVGDLQLVSASSYISQSVDYRLDASAAAGDFGVPAPALFADYRRYSIINQELRLSPEAPGRINWVAGLAYLHASSSLDGTITAAGVLPLAVESIDRDVAEYAAFGDATVALGPLAVTAGARLSLTDAADERAELLGQTRKGQHKLGFAPSLSIAWQPNTGRYVFLRYARALRPGGLAPGAGQAQGHFDSDELDSLAGGARAMLGGDALSLAASVHYDRWHDVQSDYLLDNGLISTRNAGQARIIGGDASIAWSIGHGWTLSAGLNAEQAELVSTADGERLDDRRLPVVPNVTVRGLLGYRFDIADWTVRLAGQGNYIGSARLSFDPDLDRQMGEYAVFALSSTATAGPWSVTARLDNLFDTAGDSFAFGNPFSIRDARQFTPLRPRTLIVSLGFDW
ncbi:TonB-dependent receptor [Sphingomonas koreensis]|nr:TonB-dependent receptor [Sphingomonas koreensis]